MFDHRHIKYGYILPKDYLRRFMEAHNNGYRTPREKIVGYLLADRIIDWLIAGHSTGELLDLIGPGKRDQIAYWLNNLPLRLKTATCKRDLEVRGRSYSNDHMRHKAFVIFKLRCEIAINKGTDRQ